MNGSAGKEVMTPDQQRASRPARSEGQHDGGGAPSLDTDLFPRPLTAPAPSPALGDGSGSGRELPRWLSVDQIRKMQRMRRETVLDAMLSGELPFEQRGRIRYARLSDVLAWEERRLARDTEPLRGLVHPALADLA